MLPTNYDTAKLRVDDWMRQAAHDRLVHEARAARKASRPEGSGLVAAIRRASARGLWKHDPRPQAGSVVAPTPRLAVQSTERGA
jgi:hypothetical protein